MTVAYRVLLSFAIATSACADDAEGFEPPLAPPLGKADLDVGADRIELVHYKGPILLPHGECDQGTAEIVVSDPDPGKHVFTLLHATGAPESWTFVAATYVETLPDGRDLYAAAVTCAVDRASNELVVGVTIGRQTFWDTNDGASYAKPARPRDWVLGRNTHVRITTGELSTAFLKLTGVARDLVRENLPVVTYTTDGGVTSHEVPVTFSSSSLGWRFAESVLDPAITAIDFTVSYTLADGVHVDDNFGRGYRLERGETYDSNHGVTLPLPE
jgi:hypothetical protein